MDVRPLIRTPIYLLATCPILPTWHILSARCILRLRMLSTTQLVCHTWGILHRPLRRPTIFRLTMRLRRLMTNDHDCLSWADPANQDQPRNPMACLRRHTRRASRRHQ